MASVSPLELIFEAGFGNNTSFALNSQLVTSISNYTGSNLIAPLANTLANTTAANVSISTQDALVLVASNTCPALGDSPPVAYLSDFGNILSEYANVTPADPALANVSFTTIVTEVGNAYLGNVQSSVFAQVFQGAQSFVAQNNQYLNALSAVDNQVVPGFTNYNNFITGDLAKVTLATAEFGQDLENLGVVIDLENLGDLGSPAVLLGQIIKYFGFPPLIQQALLVQGVASDTVIELGVLNLEVSDTVNKKIYVALNSITTTTEPSLLSQILQALKVTTAGITALTDLLNPVKMFPNSYFALSVPTVQGSTAIYVDQNGKVNNNLLTLLPNYVINTVSNI